MAEMPTPKKRGRQPANPTPAPAAPVAPAAPAAPAAPQVAAPQPAPQVAQPVAPVAPVQPVQPVAEPVKEKRKNTLPVKEKDANGYAVGSKSGLIYAWLSEGKYTKEQILAGLDQQYPGANNKTTLGVFLSDLQKPVGTYSVSRGCKVNKDEASGILSLTFPK